MKNIIYILLLLLITGCNEVKKESSNIRLVKIDLSDQIKHDETAFKSFHFVKLDTVADALLDEISKVVKYQDKLYVLPLSDSRIFIFSSTGEYINSLKRGQGPGEVLFVSDFNVKNDTLFVLDSYRNIKAYDLKGNYVSDMCHFDFPSFSFNKTKDGIYLFDPNINKKSNHIIHYLSNSKIEKSYIEKSDVFEKTSFLYYNAFVSNMLSYPLNDTIYNIKGEKIIPEYVIQFKGKSFYKEKFKAPLSSDEFCNLNQDKSYYRWIKDVHPFKDGIFFAFNYDKTYFVRYFNNGEVNVYSDFIKGLPSVTSSAVGHTENELIYSFSANQLKQYASENIDEGHAIEPLFSSLKEDDNPILVFVDVN